MSDFDVLVDSDAFVGLFVEHDAHHPRVSVLFDRLHETRQRLVTTNLILVETATVISRRASQDPARRFLVFARSGAMAVLHLDESLQRQAEQLFTAQATKDTSLFDCANVAVVQALHIPRIFSFDQAYPRKFKLALVA